jgi:hypothetical protein
MKLFYSLCLIFTIGFFNQSNAQVNTVSSLEAYHKTLPIEKIYLSFDKPYYSVGDTLWFKSYLLNSNFTASQRTDKIYVELFNDSLRLVETRAIVLNNGLGYGDIALSNKLKEGTYVIRAYSNWQQNFGNDYFFQKSVYIGNASNKTWLINAHQQLNSTAANKTLDLKLRITNLKEEAIGFKDVEISLINDSKRIARADLQTKQDGTITTQIPLTNNKLNANTKIVITDKKDETTTAVLPLILQMQDQLDVQFMPEGGYLVNGMFGKVAFKAIGNDGLGKDITGKIVNSNNETLAEINSTHKGMGSFYLLPVKGEVYTALYELNGVTQQQMLPARKDEGTTLRIDQLTKPDSMYIYVKATESKRLAAYQLLGQAAGETIMKATFTLKNGFWNLKLPKKDFPDGVIHFTLISPDGLALNERQVFINHKQKINLSITTNKNSYQPRDSVAVEITATKEDGTPLAGTFSVAVTDNAQVKQSEEDSSIASYFLLQSDLKGNIENPAWYFKDENQATLVALDHLLLTQGWAGYNWAEVLQKSLEIKFKAEKDNTIDGKLTGLFNKPMPNINLTMMSLGKNIFLTDTLSNAEGKFMFKNLPLLDSAAYIIKIKNAKGKTSTANISVNQFIPAAVINNISLIKPWYINADSTLLNFYTIAEKINSKTPQKLQSEGNLLKEVEVKGYRKLKEFASKTAWDANLFKEISEVELKKTPSKTLLDLLTEKIEGFKASFFWANSCGAGTARHSNFNYTIGSKLISHVMIDKINTHLVASGIDDDYNADLLGRTKTTNDQDIFATNTFIFNELKAADITNITIYKGCSFFFLDITTRGGKGPWVKTPPGTFVFRPIPTYVPKEFYSPKYTANNSNLPDLRSTIFWDANIVTDENGKAKLSFYAADKPSTYTIKLEGTDLNGRFGYQKSTITIKNKTESK